MRSQSNCWIQKRLNITTIGEPTERGMRYWWNTEGNITEAWFFILTKFYLKSIEFSFFLFKNANFHRFYRKPIIFFGDMTSEIQDRLQIFQGHRPRFYVVPLNQKMCSSPPEAGLLFFMHQKQTVHLFNLWYSATQWVWIT
jgi:hypothetical protein